MKQTLLLDLDDVCCPFTSMYRSWYYTIADFELPEPTRYNQHRSIIDRYLQIPSIFRHMPLISGCYETLNKHLHNYTYVVVTSRPPQHHQDTIDWVKDYLPPVDSIIFTDSGSKWRVRGGVIIDDNGNYDGTPCLYMGATEDEVREEAEYIVTLVLNI